MGRYGYGYGVVDRERRMVVVFTSSLAMSDLYVISLFFCCLPFTVLVLCCMLLTHTTLPMRYVVAFLCIK